MIIQILQKGFVALVPSLTVSLVLTGVGILLFLFGRATALNHLIKHHMQDIADYEFKKLLAIKKIDDITIERLKGDNKLFVETLSGIRHLVRKGGE